MIRQRQPRTRDQKFLAMLHHLPCVTCGTWRAIEAAHIRLSSKVWEERTGLRTGAGGAEKPSDRWSLPICSICHREGANAEHAVGTEAFWRMHRKDPHEIANALYVAGPEKGPMMMVMMKVLFEGLGTIKDDAA